MESATVAIALAACTTSTAQIQPLPGSLTYGGRVVHSPYRPGTVIKNTFLGKFGYRINERYVVQPDGTLKLTYQNWGQDYWIE
ncbi:hypothetical protein WGT02_37660 (plasmid) [Rhizobium sp. T1470]|uniref:hypothetical protein n=1 Tax=Rhizobium sp. T1473 TaxID=555321 RepID=UPI000462B719|nr:MULTISPECIES: hypothetical protein [Rhizobium]MCA0806898.1 hypothetical protein [Rhizobium sp. T1473]MCS0461017.1 hypothetical protein [Rhizobium favelukesii]UFS85757.1 hypothetical protein LPB79_35570 [Rhizobium sp. T136]